MIREWLQYLWVFALSFFTSNPKKPIMGDEKKITLLVVVSLILWGFFKRLSEKPSEEEATAGPRENLSLGTAPSLPRASPKRQQPVAESENMALVQAGESIVKEEEIEQSTETSVSQVRKDLGDTKIAEDSASFHGTHSSKVVEETGSTSQNLECSAKVTKQSSQSVTENRKVTTSKTVKSSSYSFEESGEYEVEG